MILTNCAACAAPLAHDHKKRCSRCKTRYCKAVTTLEEIEPIARRVFGGAPPTTAGIERHLGLARAALRAREQPSDEETSSQSK